MSNLVAWIGAEAERPEIAAGVGFPRWTRQGEDQARARDLPAHEVLRETVPMKETEPTQEMVEDFSFQQRLREEEDRERERRTYRGGEAQEHEENGKDKETGESRRGTEGHCQNREVGSQENYEGGHGTGMTGQLAPAKFLFEMAAIYPPSTDGSETTKDEDCFAKSLMDRLGLPDKPIALDDEEDEGVKSANPSAAGEGEETGGKESDEGEPGSEAAGGERKHVSALV